MNLLLVNYEYPPIGAGAASATYCLAQELARQGHRIVVLTGAFGSLYGVSVENGVTVWRCRSIRGRKDRSNPLEMAGFMITAIVALPAVIRKFAVSGAVVFFSIPCGPVGVVLKRIWRVPYVVSLRGGDVPGAESSLAMVHRVLAPLRRAVLRNSMAVVANSAGLKRMSEKADPFAVGVIPNGVDTALFRPGEHFGGETVFRVLFVGRFQEQKNLFHLLRSFAGVQVEKDTRVELHLVGDGPLRGSLEMYAAELGLASQVTWHGWIDRMALVAIYQSAGCLLNPSLYEGMPNAVLEAMACGVPVIASRVAGNQDLVVDEETGVLVDCDDVAALSGVIGRLIGDPERCRELGRKARALVVENYSWETVARMYLKTLGPFDAV